MSNDNYLQDTEMDVLRQFELGSRSVASRKVISKVHSTKTDKLIRWCIAIGRSGRALIKQLPLVRVDKQVWHLLQDH